jgi:hypothetical protein
LPAALSAQLIPGAEAEPDYSTTSLWKFASRGRPHRARGGEQLSDSPICKIYLWFMPGCSTVTPVTTMETGL